MSVLFVAALVEAAPEPLSRNLGDYVVLAREKIQIKNYFFTVNGDVGVNEGGGTIQWGRRSFFPNGSQVAADTLKRGHPGSSVWDLFANTFSPTNLANITIRNEGPLPISPFPIIGVLPALPPCVPGGSPVDIAKGGSLTLAPGTYTSVRMRNVSTLTLSGGTYCFASLKTGRSVKILVAADSEINVAGIFNTSVSSKFGPAAGSGLGATNVRLFVAGSLVKFSHVNKVTAIVVAPNALMRLGRRGFYRGQFIADKIASDYDNTFTLESCGNGIVDPGEECDAGGQNGQPGQCCDPSCHFLDPGTPCSDGNVCNGNEVCSAFGGCLAGTPLQCNDQNSCTTDSCDASLGCQNVNVTDGTTCLDQDLCNGDEICVAGHCTDQPDLDCDDQNACTTDTCDAFAGCVHDFITGCQPCATDAQCDNHDVCDGIEHCQGGTCHSGTPLDCGNTDPCTVESCDSAAGCQVAPAPDGTPCSDGTACTTFDECTGGVCGGMLVNCNDGDPCTTDSCDAGTGICGHAAIPDCSSALCTLTQGAYGAPNGAANGSGGLVTLNPSVLPVSVGTPGSPPSATANTQAALIAFLPTGGPPNQLCGNASPAPCPGDLVMNVAGDVPDPQGAGSKGYGGGVLTGQAMALQLNVSLSNIGATPPGLGALELPTAPFCTCVGTGAPAGPFTIPAIVTGAAGTVGDLLVLADQALRGVDLNLLVPGITYSDITAALDAINTGFDECRKICPCGSPSGAFLDQIDP